MNAKVTLRSEGEQTTLITARPPVVGSRVEYEGKEWVVTAYEYLLKRRIPPFELVTPRAS